MAARVVKVKLCVSEVETNRFYFPQDIVAYRTKGKVDSESAATADDDDEEEEEEEEGEDDDDEEEDDDE